MSAIYQTSFRKRAEYILKLILNIPVTNVLSGSYMVELEDVKHINATNLSDAFADDSIKIDNYKRFFHANALEH